MTAKRSAHQPFPGVTDAAVRVSARDGRLPGPVLDASTQTRGERR